MNPKLQNITNVCAADNSGYLLYFVIQGGVKCTLTTNMDHYEKAVTFLLDPACQDGDYYLAIDTGNIYIIYGTHVHHTSNMNNNFNASDFALHPKLVEFMPFTDF